MSVCMAFTLHEPPPPPPASSHTLLLSRVNICIVFPGVFRVGALSAALCRFTGEKSLKTDGGEVGVRIGPREKLHI